MFPSKPVLFLLLAAGIFFQQASKTFIVLNYQLDKRYVAAVLCENRNKPALHCNGKCHLRKQLNNDTEQQGAKQLPTEKYENALWENASAGAIRFIPPAAQRCELPKVLSADYAVPLHALFRPPCD